MSEEWLTLSEAFSRAERLSADHSLYLPPEPWSLETRGVLLDPDHGESGPNDIPFAVGNHLKCTLSQPDLCAVLKMARAQDSNADHAVFLEAFLYYWKNDAFLDLRDDGNDAS